MVEGREVVHERLRRALDLPMLVLSLGFLVVLLAPVVDPRMPGAARGAFNTADYGIWAAFAVEYVVLLATAPRRWEFVKRHPLDLVIVAVPLLRPIRILRGLRALRVLAAASSVSWRSKSRFLSRAAAAATALAAVIVLLIATAVLQVERDAPGSNIHTFGDALWWAVTTVTTVGYGDRYPVTAAGKLMAATLMVTGIALLGVITAAVAAWFVRVVQGEADGQVDRLTREVAELRGAIAELLEYVNDGSPDARRTGEGARRASGDVQATGSSSTSAGSR